jgi:hypothetical protein
MIVVSDDFPYMFGVGVVIDSIHFYRKAHDEPVPSKELSIPGRRAFVARSLSGRGLRFPRFERLEIRGKIGLSGQAKARRAQGQAQGGRGSWQEVGASRGFGSWPVYFSFVSKR